MSSDGRTDHHITPRDRFPAGTNASVIEANNVVGLPRAFHKALHDVFGLLTLDESIRFLQSVLVPGESWSERDLRELRESIINETRERSLPELIGRKGRRNG